MSEHKGITEQTIVVILAAGKGARMGKSDVAKVCFEIDGVAAIKRTITTFKKLRFNNFMVVLGDKAEQVMAAIGSEHPQVVYVYQEPQLGTGHATKIASEALQEIGYTGNILVTMGDKYLEESAINALVGGYVKQQADMALLTIPKTRITESSGGRVLIDKTGQALDIIEKPDLARQGIADELKEYLAKHTSISGSQISRIISKHIDNPRKQALAVAELLALAKKDQKTDKATLTKILSLEKYQLEISGKKYSARQIESLCKVVNPSLYLFSADAFHQGVGMLDNNNAQSEYYLTDVVKHLSAIKNNQGTPKFRVRTVPVSNPEWIQGFNSPNDLLVIQDYVRRTRDKDCRSGDGSNKPHLKGNQYCTVEQWINKIENQKPGLKKWLANIYGDHEDLHHQKCKDLIKVLHCYGKRFGYAEKTCIIRAPGRLNLMGRHVDHRGGFNNFLAFNRETIVVAGVRNDDQVIAVNVEPRQFKFAEFNISELIGRFAWSDWINFVNSSWVRNMLYSTAGDWSNYIKAAMLRLQHHCQEVKVNGINMAVYGNVPIAAGLSSSSTLVVATLQAGIALNNFDLTSRQFIDLCGEGEWFVGSRGGAGDHAAIYMGQRGKITNVGYLPFRVEKSINAPVDYQIIIANSHIKATKSRFAKDQFNAKITSYNLGLALLKQRCPEVADLIEYLRDINPQKLGCSISDIYRILLRVPQFMTRNDFRAILSKEHKEMMEVNFSSHAEPKHYHVRGVLLYGAAEVVRSRICMDYLEPSRINKFGDLMKISHDGDRVIRAGDDGNYIPVKASCSDEYLNNLIADLASEDPERVLHGQLYMQPGSYACSTEQIDRMVDIACDVPGVVGAQIAGAGLGGCIMIMARKACVAAVEKALIKHYYKPNKLKPDIIACTTTEGAGLAQF